VLRVPAISGSLRAASSNTMLLGVAARLAPDGMRVVRYEGVAGLPYFTPDLEGPTPPAPVAELRALLAAADGILICSPEYAHGVPGALKNALDWMVGGVELSWKPVAIINLSPRATRAHASLVEILTTMSAVVVQEASVTLPVMGRNLDESGMLADPDIAGPLRAALEAFAVAIGSREW
jgi:chromate reductase, NAD(P)H dehydrogenase (quinone)